MKKFLLSAACAAVLVCGSAAVQAAEEEMLSPLPPHEMNHQEPGHDFGPRHKDFREHAPSPDDSRRHHPKFDKKLHKEMGDKFANKLGLTEEQRVKADKIRAEGRAKVEPLMKQMNELRSKIDALRQENMKAFEAILTPDQKTRLDELKVRHEKMRERRDADKKMMREEKRPDKK